MFTVVGRVGWVLSGVAISILGLVAASGEALAHVKWFEDPSAHPVRWELFFKPLPLALVGGVLFATLVAGVVWRRRGRSFVPGAEAFGATDEGRAALYGIVPLILGVHAAVPLLVNGVQGNLFSPDNALPPGWSNVLGLVETGVALSLFYGGFARVASVALAGLWVAGIPLVGLEPMLDNALFLGFAAFFFLVGRGPYSVDRLLFPRTEPPERYARYAVPAVRAGLGLSFIVVAFTEKFANLGLARAFLESYPLNFTAALGLPLPDDLFILAAGSVELLLGLWLLFGIFPREIVLVALIPVNLTLTVFNWTELVGHMPIYGVLAVLLIWEPGDKNLRLWSKALRGNASPSPQNVTGPND